MAKAFPRVNMKPDVLTVMGEYHLRPSLSDPGGELRILAGDFPRGRT